MTNVRNDNSFGDRFADFEQVWQFGEEAPKNYDQAGEIRHRYVDRMAAILCSLVEGVPASLGELERGEITPSKFVEASYEMRKLYDKASGDILVLFGRGSHEGYVLFMEDANRVARNCLEMSNSEDADLVAAATA